MGALQVSKTAAPRLPLNMAGRFQNCLLPIGSYGAAALICGCAGIGASKTDLLSETQGSALIHGTDDRRDYFELESIEQRRLVQAHSVALIASRHVQSLLDHNTDESLPTWGELEDLCPDEPFADQPAAAFCSGVLLGENVILTAEHCVDLVPLEDIRVVFGYYFVEAGKLAIKPSDVYEVTTVIARGSENDAAERIDFAWLALAGHVNSPRSPAPVFTSVSSLRDGASIVAIGAAGGTPLKTDIGGRVGEARANSGDYFVAEADTFRGSSGGGAFTELGALVGILSMGSSDFQRADAGCMITRRLEPGAGQERFTYASRAIEGLCQNQPNNLLCDLHCDQSCPRKGASRIEPSQTTTCSLGHERRETNWQWLCAAAFTIASMFCRLHQSSLHRPRKPLDPNDI